MGLASLVSDHVAKDEEKSSIRRLPSLTLRLTSRGKIIGFDPKVRAILQTLDRVARTSCTVLVTGESGTGKELVVAALHDASERRHGPLVTVNCGAIPIDLIESELFGHTRGAFTGASAARRGVVAAAEGGTLFLDEVGELPLPAQVKLLRLLQQREYTPLGESRPVRCDLRIVAATHRNLEAEVRAGRFREDLYYRLNVIHVRVPALRERTSDIGLLAQHFFRVSSERAGRTDLIGFSVAAHSAMAASAWPGNVRALENAIERAVLLATGPLIEPDDIGLPSAPPPSLPKPATSTSSAALSTRSMQATPSIPSAQSTRSTQSMQGVYSLSAASQRYPGPPSQRAVAAVLPLAPASPSPSSQRTISPSPPTYPSAQQNPTVRSMPQPKVAPMGRPSDPAFPRTLPEGGVDLFDVINNYQSNLIRQALARTGGNKNKAAQLLCMNRTTLVEIIRRRKIGE